MSVWNNQNLFHVGILCVFQGTFFPVSHAGSPEAAPIQAWICAVTSPRCYLHSAQRLNLFPLFVVKYSSGFFPIPAALPHEWHESGAAIPSGMVPPWLPWSIPEQREVKGLV